MTGRAVTAAACGDCGLSRASGHLERAAAHLEQARLAWGCWADEIRQLAEQYYRVADFDDRRVLGDLGYGQALDIGGVVGEAVRAAGMALRAAAGGGADCPCAAVKRRIGSPHP
jgi:hypothetical protein